MSMQQPVATGRARAAAGVLTVGFLGVVTGVLPLAGLAFEPRPGPAPEPPAPTPPADPAPEPVLVFPEGPVDLLPDPPQLPPPRLEIAGPTTTARATQAPVTLEATLGRTDDGALALVARVSAEPSSERTPVDLTLLLDTSASMAGVMGLVKRATLRVIELLDERDRLRLVVFDEEARVLWDGPVTAEARARLREPVGQLVARKGTNLGAALEAARVQNGRGARRVWLLSDDGEPTIGETDPEALEALARAVGSPVSTTAFSEHGPAEMLRRIAGATGGTGGHAPGAGALPGLLEHDLGALHALAAGHVTLVLRRGPGVTVEDVAGLCSFRGTPDQVREVALGDLHHGQTLEVRVRLRAPAEADGVLDVAQVALTAQGPGNPVETERRAPALSLELPMLSVEAR